MLPLALAALLLALPAYAQFNPGHATVEYCAPCHGQDGIAKDSEVPNLAGQNERYLFNQLMAFRSGARRHREMRVMARELTEAEIAALAAYYASLPPR